MEQRAEKPKTHDDTVVLHQAGVSSISPFRDMLSTDGMQYHLMGKAHTSDHTYADTIRPRVQKHDYQIAMFGGSEIHTCQVFNPRGAFKRHEIRSYRHAIRSETRHTTLHGEQRPRKPKFHEWHSLTLEPQQALGWRTASANEGSPCVVNRVCRVFHIAFQRSLNVDFWTSCELVSPEKQIQMCSLVLLSDHSWRSLTAMNEKRRDHVAARVGSCVYVFGGSYLFTVARIDVYNVATQRWSVSSARCGSAAHRSSKSEMTR